MASVGLALVLLLSFSIVPPTSSCTEEEKFSLLQFLTGLSPPARGHLAVLWRNDTDCCSWEGITCNGNGTVTEVSLPSRGLEGRISPSLADLAGLLRINLSHNSISGGLPLEKLISSSRIVVLDVSFNRLNGGLQELPTSTPHHPLQVLNISSNLFTGEFPPTAYKAMKNLVAINASNNSFSGKIPSSFCINTLSIAQLDLSYNQLSGDIPPELGDCSMLRVLKIGHNSLSGTLPDELFKLSNLAILDLAENGFSGNIPDSIGQLKRLKELHLNSHNMSGELPSALSKCKTITTINLGKNNFWGELTKVNFSSLLNLKILDLVFNNFTGTVPESLYSCSYLTALRLSVNNFHGQISPRISNLKYLTFLSFSYNFFTNITDAIQILKSSRNLITLLIGGNFRHETMPGYEMFGGFENLQYLSIVDCSLSGKIPHWISTLKYLKVLRLYNNQLSGPIPAWINSLSFLIFLDVSNNSLTGKIPTQLMQMPMLKSEKSIAHLDPGIFALPLYFTPSREYHTISAFPETLNLGNNKFTGVIPPEIGQLKALHSLNLSFNHLYGEIPQSICNLTNLLLLDLSTNLLTGVIPSALDKLNFLAKFNVSNNDLQGPVPTEGQFSTFPNSSFAGNPKLCGSMLIHHCNSAAEARLPIISTKQCSSKVIFAVAFGVFCAIGVLYDQSLCSACGIRYRKKRRQELGLDNKQQEQQHQQQQQEEDLREATCAVKDSSSNKSSSLQVVKKKRVLMGVEEAAFLLMALSSSSTPTLLHA